MKKSYFHQIKMNNLEFANKEQSADEDSVSDLDSAEEFVNKKVVRDR